MKETMKSTEEKILRTKQNGMSALFLTTILYLAAIPLIIFCAMLADSGASFAIAGVVLGVIWLCVGWIPYLGLKIIKPQEALVLTLFGKYVGTLKGEGFYW